MVEFSSGNPSIGSSNFCQDRARFLLYLIEAATLSRTDRTDRIDRIDRSNRVDRFASWYTESKEHGM